jgi:hypothetical protein
MSDPSVPIIGRADFGPRGDFTSFTFVAAGAEESYPVGKEMPLTMPDGSVVPIRITNVVFRPGRIWAGGNAYPGMCTVTVMATGE